MNVPRRKPRNRPGRRGAKREPYDRVLIVCEGERTEPLYFRELADHYRLATANIEVVGSGSDPHTVVRKAKELQKRERRQGEQYDEVYCVFDRDEHPAFDNASKDATDSGLKLARSWPCFELWLLLHFVYSRGPYTNEGGRSPCGNCIRDLRTHLPGYEKATPGLFRILEDRLEGAKRNAKRAITDAERTGAPNPSTEVHELVDYLQSIKSGSGDDGG